MSVARKRKTEHAQEEPRKKNASQPVGPTAESSKTIVIKDDPDMPVDVKPLDLFPEIFVPAVSRKSKSDRTRLKSFMKFRRLNQQGPLYSTSPGFELNGTGRRAKPKPFDPFTDNEQYISRYLPQVKITPNWSTRKYNSKLFPKELRHVVDKSFAKPRHLQVEERRKQINVDEDDENGEQNQTEDENEDSDTQNSEDDADNADDDTMEDYDAEAYFDDGAGEDDVGDLYGAEEEQPEW